MGRKKDGANSPSLVHFSIGGPEMDPYRIVLVDDHLMFRQGIRKFIEELEDVQVSGEAQNGSELLELLKTSLPDLIILDLALPGLRGLEVLREVKELYPQVKVVILSMFGNEEYVRQAVIEGADGYVLKEEASSELIQAIKSAQNCHKYFSEQVSKLIMSLARGAAAPEDLTDREKEILRYLVRGTSSKEIAKALFLSAHTVRRHRYNIMHKLNCKDMSELIDYALTRGYAG
jgi:DNA-binding NarL/FixJ family response regulator